MLFARKDFLHQIFFVLITLSQNGQAIKRRTDPRLRCTPEVLKAKTDQCFAETPAETVYVKLYSAVTLPCRVGNLRGMMQWTKPGSGVLGVGHKPIVHPDKYDYRGKRSQGEKHLHIRNVTMQMEGKYECQVQPKPNILRFATKVVVLVKPSRPVLLVNGLNPNKKGKARILNGRDKQRFLCSTIGGNPSPKFEWFKNGELIKDTPAKMAVGKNVLTYAHEDWYEVKTNMLNGGETITCAVKNEATNQDSGFEKSSIKTSVVIEKIRPPGRPNIDILTRRQRYYEGDTFAARCTAQVGIPDGSLIWKQYRLIDKNDSVDHRFEIKDNYLINEFSIKELGRRDHNSKLVCLANNEATEDIVLKSEVKVVVHFPPRSVEIQSHPPSDKKIYSDGRELTVIYGRVGQTKDLTCLSGHYYPTAKIHWQKGERRIPYRQQDRVISEPAGNRLQSNISITFSREDDGKDLTCVVTGLRSTRATATIRLNIMYPPGRPYIEGYRSNQAIRYGEKVTLRCISEGGNPPPKLDWYRANGDTVIPGGRELSDGDKRIKDYTFIPQKRDNDDKYVCKSRNSVAGSSESLSSASVQLDVQFPPDSISIRFVKRLNEENQTSVAMHRMRGSMGQRGSENEAKRNKFSEGWQLLFLCKTGSSNPPVTVKWRRVRCKRDNKCTSSDLEVTKVANLPGIYNGDETHSYAKFTASWKDHLQFLECQATNHAFSDMKMRERIQLEVEFSPKFPPEVSRSRIFPEASTVEIDLKPVANPPTVRYRWLKNGVPYPGNDRTIMTKSTIRIENVQRNDMANYSLVNHNGIGETRVSFFLNVTYPPRLLNTARTNVTRRREGSVELRCRFEANPATLSGIVWRRLHPKSGIVLSEVSCRGSLSKKMFVKCKSIRKRLRVTTSLTLRDLDRTDTGIYQCGLQNGVGRPAYRKYEVLVISSAVLVVSPRSSKSAADIGGNVAIKCEAEGEPWVQFTWFRGQDNLTLASGKKYKMTTTRLYAGRYRGTLYVSNVRESDYGDYYCQASNGMAPDVVRLSLIKPRVPDAPLNLRVVNVSATSVTLAWSQGFNGGYRQNFQVRWREIVPGEPLGGDSGLFQHADAGRSTSEDDMKYTVRGLRSNREYAFTMTAENGRIGRGPRTPPVRARTRPQYGQPVPAVTNSHENKRGRTDDTSILIIATACVIGGLIFIINVFVITCILRRKGRCRGSHKQEYMKADNVEMYQHHQPPSITGSSQQGADSVTVSEALLHNYREMHPMAGAGMQPEFYEPGLYPGLPPRLVSSVPNSSPIPNSLPPPSPAQSAVLPAHTYVNVDSIMHSSFPRDPNLYHYIRQSAMPRDSYMDDAKRVHFSDSLRQRMTSSGIYASPQRNAPPDPPERTVSNQLSVSQLVIPPPQDFSPPESACESVIERPIVTASSPLRTNQTMTPMTNSITTFAAISTDPDDEGYTSVV